MPNTPSSRRETRAADFDCWADRVAMKCKHLANWAAAVTLLPLLVPGVSAWAGYPWLPDQASRHTLSHSVQPPSGYERIAQPGWSFGSWLRGLPLRGPGSTVRLFDGREKIYQGGVFAVVDIDVGEGDLQQCADAVIRLRAEYLLQAGCADRIAFDFTSGHRARWPDWRVGIARWYQGTRYLGHAGPVLTPPIVLSALT